MAVRAVACVALVLAGAPVRASIEVDAAALGDEAEGLERMVADEGQVVLRDADVLPAHGNADGTIHVELTRLDPGPGYRFVAWADHAQKEVDGTRVEDDCSGCSDQELAEAVAKAIAAMVDPLRAASEATVPVEAETAPAPKRADDRGRVRIGALGIGGIVLMSVGVGAIGGGAALLSLGRDVAPDPDDPSQLEGTDYRPGGGALMAVGVAAVVIGAVMLFVGVKKGKEARTRKAALLPAAGGLRVAF